nr:DUF5682 family protein [Candidatus Sigynarchaeota archaeon]
MATKDMARGRTINLEVLKDILYGVLDAIHVDRAGIDAQVNAVMRSDITYIPIRHHSPGSAAMVEYYIHKIKPKLVLIEGPCVAGNLVPFIAEPDTVPPVAILSMYSDETNVFKLNGISTPDPTIPAKYQVYYPIVPYSPEYIAIKSALAQDSRTPIHFIDLPLTAMIPFMIKGQQHLANMILTEEERIATSEFFRVFSASLGFDDFNEAWETLFEIKANKANMDDFREATCRFCSCIRKTMPQEMI